MRILLFLILSLSCLSKDPFSLAQVEMKKGNFIYSLVILRNIRGNKKILSQKYFLEGICYYQVGDLPKAISKLNAAKKLNNFIPDFYFNLGKILFSSGQYGRAKKSFLYSLKNKSQVRDSLLFLARISAVEQDFRQSKSFVKQIINLPEQMPEQQQKALFQLGNLHLKIAKMELKPEDMGVIVLKHVLPYYQKALKLLPSSPLAEKIKTRVSMIKKKYML